jgi:tryptophanyl-tRNA synthetase
MRKPMRILSGVQPSGKLHLGNYFGAIRQFVDLQNRGEALYFIADLHALTSLRDGTALRANTLDVALDFLALGLDPEKATLFRQSDIPEVTELYWVLGSVVPMALLERGTSYRDKIENGVAADLGLFAYPVLMAADILLYRSDLVPVGRDQKQHLEFARDFATKFNQAFVPKYDPADPDAKEKGHAPGILKLPEPMIRDETAVVPGLDGAKMSKSYGNTIELFTDDAVVRKRIMSIKTDSTPVEAPKDPTTNTVFALMKLMASADELCDIEASFRKGGKGYGDYKKRLVELFFETFGAARKKREELAKDVAAVERVLTRGAERARALAAPVIADVRRACGLR